QPRVAAKEIADLKSWIEAGAPWPEARLPEKQPVTGITPDQRKFWAFQKVARPEPPRVKGEGARTAIDHFIQAKLEQAGLKPNHAADKPTLIRRASFDLTGLPPTAAEVDAFLNDQHPDAFARVVDRLLESPRYGERWARYWLDVARYSDDRLESEVEAPYDNAFRYRDWVVRAFNDDMPYDMFVKAQLAGDQLENKESYIAGLGFYALSPDTQEDRVDATGRAFLALTTGCAQCHNHKFDPIPTRDYYAMLGVFTSTEIHETPLAPEPQVKAYQAQASAIADKKAQIRDFLHAQATQLAELFASQTARYTRAARELMAGRSAAEDLDRETLDRWVAYLKREAQDHPYLKDWADEKKFDYEAFQNTVMAVLRERRQVDETNAIRRAEARKSKTQPQLEALKPDSFYLWRDLFFSDFYGNQFKQEDDGLLYYGPNKGFYESDGAVERFLGGIWKSHLARMRQELKDLQAALPPRYPYLHTIRDKEKLTAEKIRIGGNADNLGPEVPRGFLTILSGSEPKPFTRGSGRLELAEAIASPDNPLTARVMVNRIWQHHFGAGIVRTSSDFGLMGDRPSHPELLDYLASRLVEQKWSVKAVHREIMLSAAYQLASANSADNAQIDPGNRLLWRANTRRLDAEALRDSMLYVTGELAESPGGAPFTVTEDKDHRRSVYGFISRRKLDSTLALFDFPNPNATSDRRTVTITPPQQLFFLNSGFVERRAAVLSSRVKAGRIADLYRKVFARNPMEAELRLGASFLAEGKDRWQAYVQALLNSNEFLFVN
ncbi:MAG: DUF1549 and DUF1553 domain-containing protein, partial [Bryobacteraceae bacterium]|nr:DUF1549 and DUF1553 domain-containing protein [Bryobacteraceae bacterium]